MEKKCFVETRFDLKDLITCTWQPVKTHEDQFLKSCSYAAKLQLFVANEYLISLQFIFFVLTSGEFHGWGLEVINEYLNLSEPFIP